MSADPEPTPPNADAPPPEAEAAPTRHLQEPTEIIETQGSEGPKTIIPETHELIRQEDIDETIAHLSDNSNTALPQFGPEHIEWIRVALLERRDLCARQYHRDGSVDEAATHRLKELDAQIDGVSPVILKVLHFLGRVRALIPALLKLQQEVQQEDPDPTTQMIKKMKYDCSKAEVQSALEGLTMLHIRPKILDLMAQGHVPEPPKG